MKKRVEQKRYELFLVLLVLFLCELFFFRNVLPENALISDAGDGKLTNLLTEHWYRVLIGKEGLFELPMFYPADHVLGYTDLFLLYAPAYCVFRLCGLNLFLSYKYTLMLVHAFGSVSMYVLCRRTLKLHPLWALFGTFAFSFSSSFARNLVHTQLLAICFLPLLVIFLAGFFHSFSSPKKRDLYALSAIFWFALITYTSWYVAYFTGLFALTLSGFYFLILLLYKKPFLKELWEGIRALSLRLIGYLLWLALLYVPFLKIYLPVLKNSSGYSIGDVWVYQPTFADLINVSTKNLMQGWLVRALGLEEKALTPELAQGFPIFYLLFFLTVSVLGIKRLHMAKRGGEGPDYGSLLLAALFPAVLFSFILVMRYDVTTFHLWRIAYRVIPFATSVRAIARYWLWLSFPMALAAGCAADRLWHPGQGRTSYIGPAVALVLLFLCSIEKEGVCSEWKLDEESALLENVAKVPADAEAFYIVDPVHVWEDNENADIVYNQLLAFSIASCYDTKTINGYSGQEPPGWHGIENVFLDAYEGAVFDWISDHELDVRHIYAYSVERNAWIPAADRYGEVLDPFFSPEEDCFSVSSGLLEYAPAECVWCSQETEVIIKNEDVAKNGLTIDLATHLLDFKKQQPDVEPKLEIYVNDVYVSDFPMVDGQAAVTLPVEASEDGVYKVRLSCNSYFNPKETGVNLDTRDLCLQLYYIGD